MLMARAARPAGRVVAVSLLGGVRLTTSDAVLDVGLLGRRAEVVLARLALEPGVVVSRDVLADAVWGAGLPVSWRSALRNVVVGLRRALVDAGLAACVDLGATGGGYVLGLPAGSTVDLLLLREEAQAAAGRLAAGEPSAALELAERALGGGSWAVLPAGGGEWVEGLRGEVQELRVGLELVAGEAALRLGDPGRAERLARALVASAPLREDGHRLLIGALRAAGRRAEALSVYDAFRRRLARELGALPAPATQQLFLEILAEEREEQPRVLEPSGAVPAAGALLRLAEATPFVGRRALLSELCSRARLAVEAGVFVTCLSGERGLGKTRLAAELAAVCHREGIGVLYGRCEDRPGLPYAALVEALERGLQGVGGSELERRLAGELEVLVALLPALRERRSRRAPVSGLEPERVRGAIRSALGLLAGEGALLVLDDAQWASRAELLVLEELVASTGEPALSVLVLHRDRHEAATLAALGDHPRLARLELEPLGVEDVLELVDLSGAEPADRDGLAQRVWRRSGGNPLLVAALLDDPGPEDRDSISPRVADLVRERLGRLPEDAGELLRVAAVAGVEFEPKLVCAVWGGGRERCRELLVLATAAHLLTDGGGGRLAFRHGLVRDALLGGLDAGERAGLHQRLGVGLQAAAAPDSLGLVRLAYHFAAAGPSGDPLQALRYALPVARRAYEAGVFEDVIAVASRALGALSQAGDPDPPARLELQVMWGGAQRALGDPQGLETLAGVFEAARERGDGALMADAALALSPAGVLSDMPALDERQLALYEQALAALDDEDEGRRAQLLARVAGAQAWSRSEPESRPVAERAQALARGLGDERTLAGVLALRRRSLSGSGDLRLVREIEDELDVLAGRLGDPGLGFSCLLWRFDSSIALGEGERLEALLAQAGSRARGLRRGSYHHSLAYEHAALALLRGRVSEAEVLIGRAAQVGLHGGVDPMAVESIRLTQLMLLRGEQRRLGELREQAAPLFETAAVRMWLGAMGVIDAAAGRLDGVAERIDAVLEDYERDGPTMLCSGSVIAYLAATAITLADPRRARRIRRLVEPLGGQGAWFVGFAGPIDYHLGLLDRFLGQHASARRRLASAAGFCERLGAPRWQARCQAALAAAEHAEPAPPA